MDSITTAADLINQKLTAKGLLKFDDQTKLQFNVDLDNEARQVNDRAIINVIFSLLNTIETNSRANSTQSNKLQANNNQVLSLEREVSSLNRTILQLQREKGQLTNELGVEKDKVKQHLQTIRVLNGSVSNLKQQAESLQSQYKIVTKQHVLELSRLRERIQTPMTRITTEKILPQHESTAILKLVGEQETDKMMSELSTLIKQLLHQNEQTTAIVQQVLANMGQQNGFLYKKIILEDNVALPAPNFEPIGEVDLEDIDITERISTLVDFKSLQEQVIAKSQETYEILLNLTTQQPQQDTEEVERLQSKIKNLESSLEKALEMNEKWNQKFKELEKE